MTQLLSCTPFVEASSAITFSEMLSIMQYRIESQSTYFGIPTLRSPIDFWVYQEILFEVKPDVIIEVGTHKGGSALALAHICDALGKGKVISIDQSADVHALALAHPRTNFILGDAGSVFEKVRAMCSGTVLVIEDSSHEYSQCLDVLEKYSTLVSVGSYLIVEDTICHHGMEVGPYPGPWEAVTTFLERDGRFVADRSREGFCVTWNPRGYLKRVL